MLFIKSVVFVLVASFPRRFKKVWFSAQIEFSYVDEMSFQSTTILDGSNSVIDDDRDALTSKFSPV